MKLFKKIFEKLFSRDEKITTNAKIIEQAINTKNKQKSDVKIFERLYPYQREAASKAIQNDKGIICMPTGVGKTFVSASIIADDIIHNGDFKMYVVNAPRIVLTYQLLKEVYSFLVDAKIEARYMFVHSGGKSDERELEEIRIKANLDGANIPFSEIPSGTSVQEIKKMMEKAEKQNLPLIFFSTYNSAERIEEARGDFEPFSIVLNDEAHYLVQEKFHDILHIMKFNRCYFFTATTISTPSDKGRGMNNKESYGEILYTMTPREAIELGKMVRPRLHFITADGIYNADDYNKSLNKIIKDTFEQHGDILDSSTKTLPKVLVSVRGTQDIMNFLNSKEYKELRISDVDIYAVASNSEIGNNVNGQQVSRYEFLKRLKADGKDATKRIIVLHYDILAEGIDISGFSGIMPLRTLSKSKFLQTYGRSARPDVEDRRRIDNKEIGVNDLDMMIKPYSYIMIPKVYSGNADDEANIIRLVTELRGHGYNANEDIVGSVQIHGIPEKEEPEGLNELKRNPHISGKTIEELLAEIEKEDDARLIKFNSREFLSFEETREFAQSLNLKGKEDWAEYWKSVEKPDDIPYSPDKTYKDKGWNGWGDFLGTGRIANRDREFLSFEEAREFAHFLKLETRNDWAEYCKSGQKPDDIPSTPDKTYKGKGWNGWGDFLGTGRVASKDKEYLSYEEAREFAQSLNLKSREDWAEYWTKQRPHDVPYKPQRTYKGKGWNGWGDFLGTGRVANQDREFLSFEEAREFAQSLNLKGKEDWAEYWKSVEKPENIPYSPNKTYKDKGWNGWGYFLGTFTQNNTFNTRVLK